MYKDGLTKVIMKKGNEWLTVFIVSSDGWMVKYIKNTYHIL